MLFYFHAAASYTIFSLSEAFLCHDFSSLDARFISRHDFRHFISTIVSSTQSCFWLHLSPLPSYWYLLYWRMSLSAIGRASSVTKLSFLFIYFIIFSLWFCMLAFITLHHGVAASGFSIAAHYFPTPLSGSSAKRPAPFPPLTGLAIDARRCHSRPPAGQILHTMHLSYLYHAR